MVLNKIEQLKIKIEYTILETPIYKQRLPVPVTSNRCYDIVFTVSFFDISGELTGELVNCFQLCHEVTQHNFIKIYTSMRIVR